VPAIVKMKHVGLFLASLFVNKKSLHFILLQDCELLYLSDRPEKLIMTNIAVPPISIRPSVIMDGSQRSFSISLISSTVFIFSIKENSVLFIN
jgi:hypothetical protein